MSGLTTRAYRKMRILNAQVSNNSDLWWLSIALFVAFLLGMAVLAVSFSCLLWFGISVDDLTAGVKTAIAAIGLIIAEVFAIIKKIHSPPGVISQELQTKGNIPLEKIDSHGLSVVSTEIRGSEDVLFKEEKIVIAGASSNFAAPIDPTQGSKDNPCKDIASGDI